MSVETDLEGCQLILMSSAFSGAPTLFHLPTLNCSCAQPGPGLIFIALHSIARASHLQVNLFPLIPSLKHRMILLAHILFVLFDEIQRYG